MEHGGTFDAVLLRKTLSNIGMTRVARVEIDQHLSARLFTLFIQGQLPVCHATPPGCAGILGGNAGI